MVGSGGGIGNRQFLVPKRRIPHKIASKGGGAKSRDSQSPDLFYVRRHRSHMNFRYTYFCVFCDFHFYWNF